ncbi:MAG: hypothetical protein GF349_00610 [Candidatus Magasanikbacteria bacterium]|nr:hypothetical protein [Candidatus Magasanikbacteria bacterium]
MEPQKFQKLINIAEEKMIACKDPIHDIGHAKRVVAHANVLSKDLNFNSFDHQVLILSSWWHDASRSISGKSSLVWMTCFDDILSAFMMLWTSIKYNIFSKVVLKSFLMLVCKNIGTGTLFTKIFIRKKDRLLLNAIHDADNLDVIYLERVKTIYKMVDSSKTYYYAYKITIQWYLRSKDLYMKTDAARIYVEKMIKKFIEWLKDKSVMYWHKKIFGWKWVEKNLAGIEKLHSKIILKNLQTQIS